MKQQLLIIHKCLRKYKQTIIHERLHKYLSSKTTNES